MEKFVAGLFILLPALAVGKEYFTAAVFEHRPRGEPTEEPKNIVTANLRFYEKAAVAAASKGADILVFNEFGIFPYVDSREVLQKFMENIPDPEKNAFNPCTEKQTDRTTLHSLSCMAKGNKMYVVANMIDAQPCEGTCDSTEIEGCTAKCPPDGVFMYNTNVVFDREGNLVAKYHKQHPYFEVLNSPEDPEFVTFSTDFGVFGLIVCFDSVFKESVLLADRGIDTLIFPTAWFDDVVPFNAVEWQQAWALANKVNFLAADYHQPGLGQLGSGIYSKHDGALAYTYEPDGESKLVVANVKVRDAAAVDTKPSLTIITEASSFEHIETGSTFPPNCYEQVAGEAKDMNKDYRCFKSQTENYTLVKLEKQSGHLEACNNGFCCSLTYSADDMQEDFYLVAFNGTNNARDFYHWCEETCMVVRCDPFQGKACFLQPSVSKTVFRSLKLKGRFTAERIYPTVSKNKHRLAPKSEWHYKVTGAEAKLKFRAADNEPFLKAGFFGRCYQRDPPFIPFYQY